MWTLIHVRVAGNEAAEMTVKAAHHSNDWVKTTQSNLGKCCPLDVLGANYSRLRPRGFILRTLFY